MPEGLRRVGEALGDLARWDHPLGALTTYRVGGTAALFVEPADEEQLLAVARALAPAGQASLPRSSARSTVFPGRGGARPGGEVEGSPVPVLVLGRGSNLLVADAGFPGVVVSLGAGFEDVAVDGTEVTAGAAVSLPVLARRTVAAGLTGLEWAVGVPGSVGGAIRMNAGGHGSDTAATLVRYRWVDLRTGSVGVAPAAALDFAYRHTALVSTDVVVAGTYALAPGDPERGAAAITEIVRWRRANQPGGSNAGSVFTNPPGDSAGRLIDAAGLKGFRIGTAEVSPKHANFIQADEGGSADDVVRVLEHVRDTIAATTGTVLRTEVRMVGFGEGGPGRPGGPTGGAERDARAGDGA